MRIDKFLWCVRYYKTRNLAADACKKGQVKVHDEKVKPSRMVAAGEKIRVRKQQVDYECTVLAIPPSRVGAKLLDQYLLDTTPKEQFDKIALLKLAKDHYREKGLGRPTKKDRRALDEFQD